MKRKYLIGAALGLAAVALLSRKASAAVTAGDKPEVDPDRIFDSVPGGPPAGQTGTSRSVNNSSVLAPIQHATGQVAAGVAGAVTSGIKGLGILLGGGQPLRADSVGGK